jgi:predicted kinase
VGPNDEEHLLSSSFFIQNSEIEMVHAFLSMHAYKSNVYYIQVIYMYFPRKAGLCMIDSLVRPLPTLVLMAGLPGTGKSTLSQALGRELGWPVINKDELKRTFLNMGETDMRAGIMAYETVFTFTHDLLVRQQLSIILDTASLYPFILEYATRIASEANAGLKIVLCLLESDLRAQRLKERTGAVNQHVAEPSTLEEDLLRFRHLPPNRHIIYTHHSREECVVAAARYIIDEHTDCKVSSL